MRISGHDGYQGTGAIQLLPETMTAGSGAGRITPVIPRTTPRIEARLMGPSHFCHRDRLPLSGISHEMPTLFKNRLIGRVNIR